MDKIITNDAGLIEQTMEVSKKIEGKYVPQGKITFYIPTLESAGFTAERAEADKDDTLPSYKNDKQQFTFDAIVAAVKAKVRNSLVTGTAELREGVTIPTSWDDLLAERTGGGNPEALAAIRELKADFGKWIITLGKSAKAQQFISQLFANRNALTLQTMEIKEKFGAYLSDYMEQAEADVLTKGQKYLQSLVDSCGEDDVAEDF